VWQTVVLSGLMCVTALPAPAAEAAPEEVEVKGTLRTGVIANRGETTGTILETKEGKYELDLGTDNELRKKAEELNGKIVTETGELNMRHKQLSATLFAATLVPGQQADEPAPDKQVAALSEQHRRAAMQGDTKLLDAVLADDWVVVGPTGAVETKREQEKKLKDKSLVFEAIDPQEVEVRVHGDAAIVMGLYHIKATRNGKTVDGVFDHLPRVQAGRRGRPAAGEVHLGERGGVPRLPVDVHDDRGLGLGPEGRGSGGPVGVAVGLNAAPPEPCGQAGGVASRIAGRGDSCGSTPGGD
jgi:ketosteroid isomerase-like protein